MSLPDFMKVQSGTILVFGDPGASGVTHNLGLNGCASGTAVMSASCDFGATWDEEYTAWAIIKSEASPTAGGTVDVYVPTTFSGSYWPGGVTGASGVWPADGAEDEWALQLGAPVLCLVATADTCTIQVSPPSIFRPAARYGVVVVDINWDKTIYAQGSGSNPSRVILMPRQLLVQDAA